MRRVILIWITIIITIVLSQKAFATINFNLSMPYRVESMHDAVTAITPPWVITNTSSELLVFDETGSNFSASMDFGSLPIESPLFIFRANNLAGYQLKPGESMGGIFGSADLRPPLPIPTFNPSPQAIFEFNGDYILGSGIGYLNFSVDSAYVTIPITFIVEYEGPLPSCGPYITGTFSSIPEPATLLLLGLGAVMVRKRR